ncbi:hypothetical protein [Coprobacillus cateniformis]|nr:hypothetical protein [Coprobacillus cateniformis]
MAGMKKVERGFMDKISSHTIIFNLCCLTFGLQYIDCLDSDD